MSLDIANAARRAVAWQLLRAGPVPAVAVMAGALRVLNQPEEQCGGEILDAMCEEIRSGRVSCSTASADLSRIIIGTETMLTA